MDTNARVVRFLIRVLACTCMCALYFVYVVYCVVLRLETLRYTSAAGASHTHTLLYVTVEPLSNLRRC